MPTVLEAARHKAKKEHICDYCGLKIEIGEIYKDDTCVYGDLYHWKSHLSCDELTLELDMFDFCDDGGLTADHFQECVVDYLHDEDIYLKSWPERIAKAKELLLNG